MSTVDVELGWEDEIEDGKEVSFEPLPVGTYGFRVVNFERKRHEPRQGGKIPACNKAALEFEVLSLDDGEVIGKVRKDLFLVRSMEWQLAQFFRAIGAKQHGVNVSMDWSKVHGAEGSFELTLRKYTNDKGEQRESNDIKQFIDSAEAVDEDSF